MDSRAVKTLSKNLTLIIGWQWLFDSINSGWGGGMSLDWRREKVGAETFLSHTRGWRSRHLFCRGLGLRTEHPQCVCLPNHIISSALPPLPRAAPPPLAKTTPWLLPPPRDIEMWLSWWEALMVATLVWGGNDRLRHFHLKKYGFRKHCVLSSSKHCWFLFCQVKIKLSTTNEVAYAVN